MPGTPNPVLSSPHIDSKPLSARNTGGLLFEAMRLYQRFFFTFVGTAVILNVPVSLLNILWSPFLASQTFESLFYQIFEPILDPLGSQAIVVVVFVVPLLLFLACMVFVGSFGLNYSLLSAAFAKIVAGIYQGRPVSVWRVYKLGSWRQLGRLLLGSLPWLVVLFPIGVGLIPSPVCAVACLFLPLILGMIYLTICLSLYPQVVILEGSSVFEALKRSWSLTHQFLLRTMGLTVIPYLVNLMATVGFSSAFIHASTSADPEFFLQAVMISLVWNSLVGSLFQAFIFTVMALHYFDLRIRKESFDFGME